jgi:acetyl esterase/lipase
MIGKQDLPWQACTGLIITVQPDSLRDEAEAYAAKLIAAGIPVQVCRLGKVKGNVVASISSAIISDSSLRSTPSCSSSPSTHRRMVRPRSFFPK